MDELIGIARGVLADGRLVIEEARFLLDWLSRNEPVRRDFFGATLFNSLDRVLHDEELSAEEEDSLFGLLLRFVGPLPEPTREVSYSSSLPLDDPPPLIEIVTNNFCFTGKFQSGSRTHCQSVVIAAGGEIHKYPVFATHYLVVGDLGSRDWIHSTSGRKIERAIEIRSQGHPLRIVAECHWCDCLESVNDSRRAKSSRIVSPAALSQSATMPLSGKTIVVTGTLKNYSREEIQEAIQMHGGRAGSSVSKKTDFVLAGEEAGSKLEKATKLGVAVITEEEFERLIGKVT
ncbi:MAG: BRCT domain-containing protein [Pirellulaceae bacterium]